MNYYLGLDNGGTTTKAALFDCKGQTIAQHSISTTAISEKRGFMERDMEKLWEDNCLVIKAVLKKADIDAKMIRGIGICGHGKGMYLWSKKNEPVRNGILSADNRAYSYVTTWQRDGSEEKAFQYSYQHVMASQPVALLAWLKEHEPENYNAIQWVFECKDYVRFRLSGQARAEITDYSGTGMMNLAQKAFDQRILDIFGIPEIMDALPPICMSTEIAGYVTKEAAEKTGLIEGCPVIGGMFDINACAIASGVLSPDRICMIAGTWSINEYPDIKPVLDGSIMMNSLFCIEPYYLIEESSPTSAGNLEWFIHELCPDQKDKEGSIYDWINEAVDTIPPSRFVPIFLPFLMASNVHPNARASFIGLSMHDSRKVLLRSIFEGVCFGHRYHLERLLLARTEACQAIRLSGGAAKSKVWAQMFADIMKIPVETVIAKETGALGCAIAAAAAAKEYASLEQAAEMMSKISQRYEPNSETFPYYDSRYHLYCRIIENLDSIWDEMQTNMEIS